MEPRGSTVNGRGFSLAPYVFLGSFVFTLVCLSNLAFGAPKRLVIDTDEYHYEATFDSNRISEARLRELLPFSPYAGIGDVWKLDDAEVSMGTEQRPHYFDKSPIANDLELCVEGDPKYRACGTRDMSDPNFFVNAQVNVESSAKWLAGLDRLQVPEQLRPIVKHYRDALLFSSMLEKRRLDYLRTWDLRALSMPIGEFDPATTCARELKQLQSATTLEQRYDLSRRAWHNCASSRWQHTSPQYPVNAWRSFVAAYGIKERYEFKAID